MKKVMLTESQLQSYIYKSAKRLIKEMEDDMYDDMYDDDHDFYDIYQPDDHDDQTEDTWTDEDGSELPYDIDTNPDMDWTGDMPYDTREHKFDDTLMDQMYGDKYNGEPLFKNVRQHMNRDERNNYYDTDYNGEFGMDALGANGEGPERFAKNPENF